MPLIPIPFCGIDDSNVFADVHRHLGRSTLEHRVLGADLDEVLYADDTICISEDSRTMNKLIKRIEEEGEKYGMRLNYNKCELIKLGDIGTVRMRDGTRMKPVDEVKYLGCQLHNRADGIKEVKKKGCGLHGGAEKIGSVLETRKCVIEEEDTSSGSGYQHKTHVWIRVTTVAHDGINKIWCFPVERVVKVVKDGNDICE